MIKRTKQISINILSVFVILISILLVCVGSTSSWFTQTTQNNVRVEVVIANLNLQLYQKIGSSDVKIHTTIINTDYEADENASTNSQYLVLDDKILPDEYVPITLTLKNEDTGSSSMYVRFKFELYRRTPKGDVLVPVEVLPGGIATGKTAGFGIKEGDSSGYCYYQDSSQANALFEVSNTGAVMMTKFKVPYTSFIDSTGKMLITNSETCFIRILVEASLYQDFHNL